MAQRRETRLEPGNGDSVCRVCLQPIRAADKVRGSAASLIHEACDYTRARGGGTNDGRAGAGPTSSRSQSR